MPRITISRVLGLVPLTWVCLVGTWFFLPSPVVQDISRDDYIQHQLRIGSTVTTVIGYGDSVKFTNNQKGNECSACSGLILDYRLEAHRSSDSLMLRLGEARVNLTEAVTKGVKGYSEDVTEKDRKPYVLSPAFSTKVRGGGTEHSTVLPWFRWTDKVLIDNIMHGGEENIDVRIFSPRLNVVEVWKDIAMWDTWTPEVPIRDTEREVGLLATFSHVPTQQFPGTTGLRANTANVQVSKIPGQLPSRTWPIRRIIAGPLYVPTFMLTVIIWRFTFDLVPMPVILAFQMLCIVLIFIRLERINLSPSRWLWSERAKRPKTRGIWGAAGPITDEESGVLSIRPQKTMTMFPHSISKPSKSRAPVFDKA